MGHSRKFPTFSTSKLNYPYDYPYDYPPVSYFQGSKNQKNITTGGAFSKLAATSGGWGRDAGDIQITEDVTK